MSEESCHGTCKYDRNPKSKKVCNIIYIPLFDNDNIY